MIDLDQYGMSSGWEGHWSSSQRVVQASRVRKREQDRTGPLRAEIGMGNERLLRVEGRIYKMNQLFILGQRTWKQNDGGLASKGERLRPARKQVLSGGR